MWLFLVLFGMLHGATITLTTTMCAGGGKCVTFPSNPATSSPPVFYGGPRTNPFTDISPVPELNTAFNKAQLSLLEEGQSPETKQNLKILKEAIDRYGGPEKALSGLSGEHAAKLTQETNRLLAEPLPAVPTPSHPITPPTGVSVGEMKTVLAPIQEAIVKRDPFKRIEELDKYQRKAARARRETRGQWQNAIAGHYSNSDGIIHDLEDAEPIIHFKSNRSSEEGMQVRTAYNQILVAEQLLEGGYRGYCEKEGKSSCEKAKGNVERARKHFAELTLLTAAMDTFIAAGNVATIIGQNVLYLPIQMAWFTHGVAKGFVEGTTDLLTFAKTLATDPLRASQAFKETLDLFIFHQDKFREEALRYAHNIVDVIMYGSAEQQGILAGKFAFELTKILLTPGTPTLGKIASTLSIGADLTSASAGKLLMSAAVETALQAKEFSGPLAAAARPKLSAIARAFPQTARSLLLSESGGVFETVGSGALKAPTLSESFYFGYGDKTLSAFAGKNGAQAVKLIEEQGYKRAINVAELHVVEKLHEATAISAVKESKLFGRSQVFRTIRDHLEAGPLEGKDALTFLGAKYTEIVPAEGEVFYRIGEGTGTFWSRTKPSSQIQAMSELAILPAWNDFTKVTTWVVPKDFTQKLYEGLTGNIVSLKGPKENPILFRVSDYFHGGGNQVFVPENVLKTPEFTRGLKPPESLR